MEYKNLQWFDEKKDMYHVEINHPEHGWIPFTVHPDDPEPTTIEMMKIINSLPESEIGEPSPPEPKPEPPTIEEKLEMLGITKEELKKVLLES